MNDWKKGKESYDVAVSAILNMMYERLNSYVASEQKEKEQAIRIMIKDIEFAMLGKE